jgi:hypothetical protein
MDSNKAKHLAGDGAMQARFQSFLSIHGDFRVIFLTKSVIIYFQLLNFITK